MISCKTHLTIKKGERIYEFFCEGDSPLGELHDVLHEMKQHVVEKIIEQSKTEHELLHPHVQEEVEVVNG